jgi:hypothetical protein
MNFAALYDYRMHLKEEVLNMVTDSTPNVRRQAESYALEEIRGSICGLYDASKAFNHHYFDLNSATNYLPGQTVIDALGQEHYCIAQGNPTLQTIPASFVLVQNLYFFYSATATYQAGVIVADNEHGIQYLCIADTVAGDSLTDKNKFALRRNPILLQIYLDIALYHLFSRIHQKQVQEIRIDRYNDAIANLKLIRKGLFCLALPKADNDGDGLPDTGNSSAIEIQSNPKINFNW